MGNQSKFSRRLHAIDHLPHSPLATLEDVWKEEDISHFIHGEITIWFYMALSNDTAIYVDDDGESRVQFIEFFAGLLPIIEASYCYDQMYLYHTKHRAWPDGKQLTNVIREKTDGDYSCIYLTENEMIDPRQVMVNFCIKYPIEYPVGNYGIFYRRPNLTWVRSGLRFRNIFFQITI